ncbi:hypothetical protein CDD80_1063 [Ophiocordyceps camponoti-rufipedis]|uniref:FAD-binding domain-containing protein n=1 Tax=Ophiocordyceps camponoti-rufipedis TaxID=2004952 RepID=A0A2C5ZMM9_9HYPO|nr:hypothetical protein CDD80_1063 [Ophiocordyceps camponoti-rufipedis]
MPLKGATGCESTSCDQSINLTLSERGITAVKQAGHAALLNNIMNDTVPVIGRMAHGRDPNGSLYERSHLYDAKGRATQAIDRFSLNSHLQDAIRSMPNVDVFFSHKLIKADLQSRHALFETQDGTQVTVSFDLLIGADGAHSAVRQQLLKSCPVDYQQQYHDIAWVAFHLSPGRVDGKGQGSRYRISPNHLHIWPSNDLMFVAIANKDGSFTCTLFLPTKQSAELNSRPSDLPAFFDSHFPGVTDLIPAENLISSFIQSPSLPIFTQKCRPFSYSSSCVIVGDAAHTIVPFYGQGVNAGMEDVRILFSILDKHTPTSEPCHDLPFHRSHALAEYSAVREADAHAIHSLALDNYAELRACLSRRYRARKLVEEFVAERVPASGWQTRAEC